MRHTLFLTFSLVLTTVFTSCCGLEQQKSNWHKQKVLCSFAQKEDLTNWNLRETTPPSTFKFGTDKSGNPAAVLFYPKYNNTGEKWPAITFKTEKLPITDWSDYRYLSVTISSPLGDKLPLRLYLRNKAGVVQRLDFKLPAGTTSGTIRMDLNDIKDRREMQQLHLFMTTPHMDCPFTVRDLILESEDAEVAVREQLQKLQEITAEIHGGGKAFAPIQEQLAELSKCIKTQYAILNQSSSDEAGNALFQAIQNAQTYINNNREILSQVPYEKLANKVPATASFGYGIKSSMEKVLWKDIPFNGPLLGNAKISLAGDEEESVQIAVLTLRDVKNLKAEVHFNSAVPLNIEASWLGHVKCEPAPYNTSYSGWWPDPILSFLKTVDVPAKRTEALWVTVRAPRGTPAGTYQASIKLSSTDGTTYNVPLQINVFDFDLPEKRHLPLAMSWGEETMRTVYGLSTSKYSAYQQALKDFTPLAKIEDPEVRRLVRIRNETAEFLLRKRVEPDFIYRSTSPNLDQVKKWISLGMTRFNLLHVTANNARNIRILEKVMPEVERRGLLPYAYVYGFDEATPEKFEQMKPILENIKKRWPKLQIMTTACDYSFGLDTGLDKIIDIWVPLTSKFVENLDQISKARQQGMQVWWYTCCGPHHPWANWFIEYDAIEARLLMGEQAFFSGTEGYLYYQLARWVHQVYSDPIRKPISTGPLTDWDPHSYSTYNGDGSIFCPGPEGPLSTIRLENIRDGLEDYEYLWMLRRANELVTTGKAKSPSRKWKREVERALTADQPLNERMTQYDRNPASLRARRQNIAALLESWTVKNQLRTTAE